MREFRNWRSWTVALRAVATLVLGVLSIWAPGAAFMALVVLFGVCAGALALGLTSQVLLPGSALRMRRTMREPPAMAAA